MIEREQNEGFELKTLSVGGSLGFGTYLEVKKSNFFIDKNFVIFGSPFLGILKCYTPDVMYRLIRRNKNNHTILFHMKVCFVNRIQRMTLS